MLGAERFTQPMLQPVRPWGEFFGKCTIPTPGIIIKRVEDNIMFYQTNYLIVSIFCLIFAVIRSPVVLIVIPLIMLMLWFSFIKRSGDINIGKFRIPKNFNVIALSLASALIVFWSGSWTAMFFSSSISSAFIAVHCVLRARNTVTRLSSGDVKGAFNPEEVLKSSTVSRTTSSQYQQPSYLNLPPQNTSPSVSTTTTTLQQNTTAPPPSSMDNNASPSDDSQSLDNRRNASRTRSEVLRQKQLEMKQRIRDQFNI